MSAIQRTYKDRLFNFIFGRVENRAWTLNLYNIVNGSDYSDPECVQINTIQEVLYLGMRNDVSFLISSDLNLYEQQSTYNPNMPLRMLQYTGNLYEKYIAEQDLNKFGTELLQLPVPKLIVFYNGRTDLADETILFLRDSFPEGADPDISVRVRMININYGRNRRILDACEPLKEYAWLIHEIRKNNTVMGIEEAVRLALNDMPAEYVIRPFLKAHQKEVYGMLLTEYNEAETMRRFARDAYRKGLKEGHLEGHKEGRKEGRKEGEYDMLFKLVKTGVLTVEAAAIAAGMTVPEFENNVLNMH